jgi:hypothetical protein
MINLVRNGWLLGACFFYLLFIFFHKNHAYIPSIMYCQNFSLVRSSSFQSYGWFGLRRVGRWWYTMIFRATTTSTHTLSLSYSAFSVKWQWSTRRNIGSIRGSLASGKLLYTSARIPVCSLVSMPWLLGIPMRRLLQRLLDMLWWSTATKTFRMFTFPM